MFTKLILLNYIDENVLEPFREYTPALYQNARNKKQCWMVTAKMNNDMAIPEKELLVIQELISPNPTNIDDKDTNKSKYSKPNKKHNITFCKLGFGILMICNPKSIDKACHNLITEKHNSKDNSLYILVVEFVLSYIHIYFVIFLLFTLYF